MSCPAEQDLLQLGHTSIRTSSDRMQRSVFQRERQKTLVTPLVTEFGCHDQSTKTRAMAPTKQEILGASAG